MKKNNLSRLLCFEFGIKEKSVNQVHFVACGSWYQKQQLGVLLNLVVGILALSCYLTLFKSPTKLW